MWNIANRRANGSSKVLLSVARDAQCPEEALDAIVGWVTLGAPVALPEEGVEGDQAGIGHKKARSDLAE